MIKMIVSDIDGTLVKESSARLNPEYFKVIKALKEKGVLFVAASGRQVTSIQKFFAPVADEIWMLAHNGNVICHGEDYQVLNPLPQDWARDFMQDLSQHKDLELMINCAKQAYVDKDCKMYRIIRDNYGYKVDLTGGWENLPEEEICQVTVYHDENAEEYFKSHGIYEKWQDKISLTPTGRVWVDCFMPGNGKGKALESLCEKLSIKPEEVVAFGDNINDLGMIVFAGQGYAVDTAREVVKEAADYVIPGYDQDGVLQEMKKILEEMS